MENLKPPWTTETAPRTQGHKSAGSTIRDHMNKMVADGTDEDMLRSIAKDKKAPVAQRMAAMQLLKAVEISDPADFDPYLDGSATLSKLRDAGIDTTIVKKAKVAVRSFGDGESETTREVELRDRASEALDKIIGHTAPTVNEIVKNERLDEGKPTDRLETTEYKVVFDNEANGDKHE